MSEQNLQLCRFCERNVKLAYYCEDCGASCCSDCLNEEKLDYFVCQDCDSKNIEIHKSEGIKFCKECGSHSINKISQHTKSCPKCHSHKIINIFEKKEGLEQKYLELIKKTRNFINPFQEIINKLNALRYRIKNARDPPIRCYHYPRMESELLALFKLMIYVKNNLREKISIHFRNLSLNREYFFELYAQPNSNIRIIEEILENLYRSYDSINEFINKNIEIIAEKFESFQKQLEFIDKINNLFLSYKRFLNLANEEKPVYAIRAKLSNGLNTQDAFRKNKGILFITNFDLSFIHEHGVIKKKQDIIFKAPVNDLINIREKGRLFKKLYIEFSYGKYEFSLPSKSISNILEYIILARNFDKTAIYDRESAVRLQEIELDIQDLANQIEEGINSFFSLKCQYNKNMNFSQNIRHETEYNRLYNQNISFQNNQIQAPFTGSLWQQNHIEDPRCQERNQIDPGFYSQNLYAPNKFQNYESGRYSDSDGFGRFRGYKDIPDIHEKNILMKNLEKVQKYGQKPYSNNNNFNGINNFRYDDPRGVNFQNFNKNHLSDLFNSDNHQVNRFHPYSPELYDDDDEKHKNLLDLKREQFSLKETLKKLDAKFDQGIISEVDYFRTFKNYQKEIYLIDKKVRALSEKISQEKSLKRNKRYFT